LTGGPAGWHPSADVPDAQPARRMVALRLPVPLIERWHRAAWRLRLRKGELLCRALDVFLARAERPAPDAGPDAGPEDAA